MPRFCPLAQTQALFDLSVTLRVFALQIHQMAAALPDRPYEKMVAALGGYGERVEDPEEIRPALERARGSGKPACLNVILDPKLTG